ncbi:MAG: M23 family metallopeptidase, partial [Solirubrobacteraceae bacterium]|nr:M23 family metallopeptidase [Solirubrobacteraceae bacterium]
MVVRKISCLTGCSSIDAAAAGATLRFQGPMLARGKRVVYLGGAGPEDDVLAKVRVKKSGNGKLVTALLPKRAKSGPVAFELKPGARSGASRDKVVLPTPVAALAPLPGNGPFFPIRGSFKFGTGAATFGGGRGHQGYDVFAKCGTPLVAAEGGTVLFKEFHARAGNYVVIDVAGADRDEAYMHLRTPALVDKGAEVAAGQQIGEVGDTGRASGCHLHFELWEGTWQSLGGKPGKPIDP